MNNIQITLDLTKVNKHKITERKYTNKSGSEVAVKEYKLTLVPIKEQKVISSGDTWELRKTHAVAEAQTKEEKSAKDKFHYIGEGFTFFNKDEVPAEDYSQDAGEEINSDDIPF